MDLDEQKLIVRQFYAEQYKNLLYTLWDGRHRNFTFPFEQIASVRIGELTPLEVTIARIDRDAPKSVSDAFDRHLWYSQWNFANVFLTRVSLHERDFFFLFHEGIGGDAWENDTSFSEIFSDRGEFLGATDGTNEWYNEPLSHEDFRDGKTGAPPPPWLGDAPDAVYYGEPLWTEEMMLQGGKKVEDSGNTVSYIWHW